MVAMLKAACKPGNVPRLLLLVADSHLWRKSMSAMREALRVGRARAGVPLKTIPTAEVHAASAFEAGAIWVKEILLESIGSANSDLSSEGVEFKVDVNLEPQSTNHAHADFWLASFGEGCSATGPKYSINVIEGQIVWLYKAGAEGRALGTVSEFGPDKTEAVLREAVEEFGQVLG